MRTHPRTHGHTDTRTDMSAYRVALQFYWTRLKKFDADTHTYPPTHQDGHPKMLRKTKTNTVKIRKQTWRPGQTT